MSKQLAKPGIERNNVLIGSTILVVLVLIGLGVWTFLSGKSHQSSKPPKITLIAQAPPPPPPPPKFEKKPDPPKEQKEIKVEQPKPAPPQPSPQVNEEGKAGDGPSVFGAGKITNDDISKIGTGGSGGTGMFNPFNNYANLIKGDLQRYLRKDKMLRQRNYTIEIRIWVASGGVLKKFELVGSTGDSETDDAVQQAMKSLSSFDQPPPAHMPQPILLRIVTAG